MLGEQDTIAAIGTAQGVGALGIIRISGLKTREILGQCFASKHFSDKESHRAFYGVWKNPLTQQPVDEVLVLNFTDGKGFTGEDAADVICHGGVQVTELVLEGALEAGARLARPGEFTYRAVMNNKLDLARAESVLELIQANSPRAAAAALKNIRGGLSQTISKLESGVIFVLANLEASIDFTTEDIQPVDSLQMLERVREINLELSSLIVSYVNTRAMRQGVRVALVGQPNVGKSSLLNALTGKNRSIVANQPGTTRDTVEEDVIIDGVLFRLIDTAGLRVPQGEIENEGIRRTREEMSCADIIVFVVDSSASLNNLDVEELRLAGASRTVICFNKSDTKTVTASEEKARFGLNNFNHASSSAMSLAGTQELSEFLKAQAKSFSGAETASVVSTQRQKELLENVRANLSRAEKLLSEQASPEFVAFEIKEALTGLQAILGKNVGDDVMDRVFKEFCIGK